MWLNRVFSDLANTEKQHYLTIACSSVNKNGPGRYRTQANDPEKQVCYFNKPRDNDLYNFFISNRIKTEHFCNGIYLEVDRVQDKDETFDAEKTLKRDGVRDRFSKFDTDSEQPELNGRGRKRGNEKFLRSLSEGIGFMESKPDLDLFQNDNDVKKTPTKYRNTKVKTRNLLTNVSHRRYKPEDVENLLSLFSRF